MLTQTTQEKIPQKELEQLAQTWAAIKNDIAKLKEHEEAIKQHLSHLEAGNYPAGAYTIQIQTPRKTLNKQRLQKAFPPEKYPLLYTRQLDTTAIAKQFPPAVLEQYKTTSTVPVIKLT